MAEKNPDSPSCQPAKKSPFHRMRKKERQKTEEPAAGIFTVSERLFPPRMHRLLFLSTHTAFHFQKAAFGSKPCLLGAVCFQPEGRIRLQ